VARLDRPARRLRSVRRGPWVHTLSIGGRATAARRETLDPRADAEELLRVIGAQTSFRPAARASPDWTSDLHRAESRRRPRSPRNAWVGRKAGVHFDEVSVSRGAECALLDRPRPTSESDDHLPEGRTFSAPCSGAGMARLGDAGARVGRSDRGWR